MGLCLIALLVWEGIQLPLGTTVNLKMPIPPRSSPRTWASASWYSA